MWRYLSPEKFHPHILTSDPSNPGTIHEMNLVSTLGRSPGQGAMTPKQNKNRTQRPMWLWTNSDMTLHSNTIKGHLLEFPFLLVNRHKNGVYDEFLDSVQGLWQRRCEMNSCWIHQFRGKDVHAHLPCWPDPEVGRWALLYPTSCTLWTNVFLTHSFLLVFSDYDTQMKKYQTLLGLVGNLRLCYSVASPSTVMHIEAPPLQSLRTQLLIGSGCLTSL